MVTRRCAPCTNRVLLLKFKTEGSSGKSENRKRVPLSIQQTQPLLCVEQSSLMSWLWSLDALIVRR
jgi:hypothetical protein